MERERERESKKPAACLCYKYNKTASFGFFFSFFLSFFLSFFFFFFLCFTHSLWEIKGKRARKKVSKIERQEKVRKFKSTIDAGYRLSVLCVCVYEWDFLIHWERFFFLLLLWSGITFLLCFRFCWYVFFFFPYIFDVNVFLEK